MAETYGWIKTALKKGIEPTIVTEGWTESPTKFFVCLICSTGIHSHGYPFLYYGKKNDCYHVQCVEKFKKQAKQEGQLPDKPNTIDVSKHKWFNASDPKWFIGDAWPIGADSNSCMGCGHNMVAGGPRPFLGYCNSDVINNISLVGITMHLDCTTGFDPALLTVKAVSHLSAKIEEWVTVSDEKLWKHPGYVCLMCNQSVTNEGFPIMWIHTEENCSHLKCVQVAYAILGKGSFINKQIKLVSFGFKYGKPEGEVIDLRQLLRNPWFDPELRKQTGKDEDIQRFIRACGGFPKVKGKIFSLMLKPHVETIYLGCNGGRHRSVAIGEILAKESPNQFSVEHRDLEKA